MRLLNTETLEFTDFFEQEVPGYYILSHRWLDEVTYEDYLAGKGKDRIGYEKIVKLCEIARSKGCQWAWIDTCCIDKKSSAELSESINSMFDWYRRALVCLVFLPDVHTVEEDLPSENDNPIQHVLVGTEMPEGHQDRNSSPFYDDECAQFRMREFRESEWFQRSWTLQELLAPFDLQFFNSAFRRIGSRLQLTSTISDITDIDRRLLGTMTDSEKSAKLEEEYSWSEKDKRIERILSVCFAQKMSWAARREASRKEDEVYSLIGLLGINTPLLYGEGLHRAFRRVQIQYFEQTHDDSMFVWYESGIKRQDTSLQLPLLAPDVASFEGCSDIENTDWLPLRRKAINVGLEVELPIPDFLAKRRPFPTPIFYGLGCKETYEIVEDPDPDQSTSPAGKRAPALGRRPFWETSQEVRPDWGNQVFILIAMHPSASTGREGQARGPFGPLATRRKSAMAAATVVTGNEDEGEGSGIYVDRKGHGMINKFSGSEMKNPEQYLRLHVDGTWVSKPNFAIRRRYAGWRSCLRPGFWSNKVTFQRVIFQQISNNPLGDEQVKKMITT